MFNIAELRKQLSDDSPWVVVDSEGRSLRLEVPAGLAPATLLVGPVTEALKKTGSDGRVVESVDRDEVQAIEGYALHRTVLEGLADAELDQHELIGAVEAAGIPWHDEAIEEMSSRD